MKYDPQIHQRRSIRLKGYDYSSAGAYFVTIFTQERECFLGEVKDGHMILNPAGKMVHTVWLEIPIFYQGTNLDEFIVMPKIT